MKKGRIWMLLLAVSVVFGAAVFGREARAETFGDFNYTLTNHKENIKIEKYLGSDEEVVIPEEIEGKKVLTIGGAAFSGRNDITSVTIPNTVTGISGMAFSGCTGLEVMILPDSVTTIGSFAFSNCSSLVAVSFPDGLETIDAGAFTNCSSLKNVTIPAGVITINSLAFSGCTSLASLKVSEDNRVFDSREKCNAIIESNTGKLIAGCMNTVIPEDVKEIGAGAFNGCASLLSIRIPESVQAIGESAFLGCVALKQIILKKGSYADTWAQQGGYSAAVIYEGDPYYFRVTEDGAELLKYCGNDTKLVIPQEVEGVTVTGIGTGLFAGQAGITEVTVPGSVTAIGDSAFSGCSGLTQITLPAAMTQIGQEAFSGCSKLTSISIPKGVAGIGKLAFSGCSELSAVVLPAGVTEIGDSAFYGCSALASMELPAELEQIGENAFYGCSGLKELTIPEKVTSIGKDAFSGCSKLETLTVKKGSYADTWAGEQGYQTEYIAGSEPDTTEAPQPSTQAATEASQSSTQASTEAPQPSTQAATKTLQPSTQAATEAPQPSTQAATKAAGVDAQTTTEKPAKKQAAIEVKSYEKEYGCKAFALKAACDSDGTLTYKSSDPKVATVSAKGKVKVKGCGTAKITISVPETEAYEAAEKTVTVKVVPGQVKGFGIPSMAELNKRRKLFVKWKKQSGITGYEIRWSTKSFTSKQYKSKKVSASTKTYDIADYSTIRKLNAKYFYVKIRAYKKAGKKTYYGKWKTLKISGGA